MLDVVKYVMKCLSVNDLTNPQELDRAVIGFFKKSLIVKICLTRMLFHNDLSLAEVTLIFNFH